MKNILYINHNISYKCGVYTQGIRHFNSLKDYTQYNFIYCEVGSYNELEKFYTKHEPVAILYNYMPVVLPWINHNIKNLKTKNICIIHNITQELINNDQFKYSNLFDYYITLDTSLNVDNNILFKTERPLYHVENINHTRNPVLTIGTFGFPFIHKGFHKIVKLINEEFDEAIINLHMTDSHFCQNETNIILKLCSDFITKKNIKINYTNHYLSEIDMVKYLSNNDINALMYDNIENVGVSAAIDYLISAQKPILISESQQFRNYHKKLPTYPHDTFKDILKNYTTELNKVTDLYNQTFNIKKQTKEILDHILYV
jgi:hypothetical protein